MTKSTLTRDELNEVVATYGKSHIVHRMAKQLLAAMDSEPVYQCEFCHTDATGELHWHWEDVNEAFYKQYDSGRRGQRRILHSAPQPAAVVPDEVWRVAAVLELIGSFEAADIDSDTVDLRFEIDDVDTGSEASITEYAARGAAVIRMLAGNAPVKPVGCILEALENIQTENELARDQLVILQLTLLNRQRKIAELESRTVKLPKPISVLHRRDFTETHSAIYAYPEAEVNAALDDAGIKWEQLS
ncbi:hypothetical protein [Klebsiella grimontii]|uniref:hypothetical protein n=1 Tax=Klebsiella grimontii TaxID=2058152 RepID=UPI002113DF23|nr:hypothetical protein [Klebsiella grimontii]